jgi:uncharacterized protein DUF4886
VGRVFRVFLCAVAGVVLGVSIFVGLVQSGLVGNPLGPVSQGDLELARSDRAGLRVLFVGNSFTFRNSMPALVHELAAGDAGAAIFAVQYTAPRWTLEKASQDDGLEALLEEVSWDVVVLQEKSWFLSLSAEQRRKETYPFARGLQREIAVAGARTMLFMTWGYKDGDRWNWRGDNYDAMQLRLAEGYGELARELSAELAPVGLAWREALRRDPGIDLWAEDGKHPSLAGSYLAACVFYAILSGRDPAGSDFTAELPPTEARFLQDVAFDVLGAYAAPA